MKPQSREEFWADVESELGERVIARSMGQYYGDTDRRAPLWGLIFLSESALHFRHFPQNSWFSTISAISGSSSRRAREEDEEIVLRVDRSEVLSIVQPPARGFFARLFHSEPQVVQLLRAEDEPFRLTIEYEREHFIGALRGWLVTD